MGGRRLSLPPDFEAHLRRRDPDRWLSSRFVADPQARDDLVLLYAFDHELARIPALVTEPLIGEIRFAWWREGLDEIAAGGPVRAHPVLQALAETQGRLPSAPLQALLEARQRRLDASAVTTPDAVLAWLDETAGALASLAARRLDPEADPKTVTAAARAWGLARLDPGLRAVFEPAALEAFIRAELKRARREARRIPSIAFPAVAHATLARTKDRPGPLTAQLRILAAVATGRL